MKICIDFQGGAHGNFLEFVCNVVAGAKTNESPFNKLGASHSKTYLGGRIFYADHFSFGYGTLFSKKIISIQIDIDDLLPLSQISLLRAGDYGYDNNNLEVGTYNKLNNKDYRWVLDTIIHSFFENQIKNSYDAVKDPSWPKVDSIDDFNNLPVDIRKECLESHNLELLELNERQPDCPRYILREFFQIGFLNPEGHGFMTQQAKINYSADADVYVFPFKSFYKTHEFISEIKKIASWANLQYTNWDSIIELHKNFLEKQPYKDSKAKCDKIVQEILHGATTPEVNLLEESYINAMLIKQGYECRY